jgi:hypothetical protein
MTSLKFTPPRKPRIGELIVTVDGQLDPTLLLGVFDTIAEIFVRPRGRRKSSEQVLQT